MNDEREEGRAARALAETLPAPLSSSPASRDDGASPTLLAGRYEVQGLLGGGAMGAVYRAFDRALEEAIALKVLRRELARDPDALERFRREVKLARRVTHANVARTFDLGESDGELFLTMELVLGESLGARLAREGALPLAEAARITGEVVRGLVAAHAADVVHRDLKPDNVMLDGARVVITDFGVARAVARGDARRSMGVTGTPAYMAPEQVEGRADVDGRADFYALGVMLFEMLTGELPFDGDSALAIAAARLTREAPDVTTFAPALPAAARDLVGDLLVRDRARRLTDPSVLLARVDALSRSDADAPPSRRRGPSAAEISRRERTVAVVPFSNRGVEADLYLAEGLAEDVVDALSVVSGVRVRPLSQVRELAGRDARDAGRILGVDVVVEGSVRREGERLRMSVRLITVQDGFQLWAKRLIVEPGALSSLGDQIADEVAGASPPRAPPTRGPSAPRPTTSSSGGSSSAIRAGSRTTPRGSGSSPRRRPSRRATRASPAGSPSSSRVAPASRAIGTTRGSRARRRWRSSRSRSIDRAQSRRSRAPCSTGGGRTTTTVSTRSTRRSTGIRTTPTPCSSSGGSSPSRAISTVAWPCSAVR